MVKLIRTGIKHWENGFGCYEEEGDSFHAVVVSMNTNGYSDVIINKVLVVKNVSNHDEAYHAAKSRFKLGCMFAEQVGISLFISSVDIPLNWNDYEVKYLNGEII